MREAGVLFMVPRLIFVGTLLAMIVMGMWATIAADGTRGRSSLRRTTGGVHYVDVVAFAASFRERLHSDDRGRSGKQWRAGFSQARGDFGPTCAGRDNRDFGCRCWWESPYLAHVYGIVATVPGSAGLREHAFAVARRRSREKGFSTVSVSSRLSWCSACRPILRLWIFLGCAGRWQKTAICRTALLIAAGGWSIPKGFAFWPRWRGTADYFRWRHRQSDSTVCGWRFLAFTLSQGGMVAHWNRSADRGARYSMLINGLGTVATGITTAVVVSCQVHPGGLDSRLAGAGIDNDYVGRAPPLPRFGAANDRRSVEPNDPRRPLVIVPIDRWSRISRRAMRFAVTLSDDIEALHVECEKHTTSLRHDWHKFVQEPARKANRPVPQLVVLKSPYRFIIKPVVERILELEKEHPDRMIAVLLPELIERHWLHYFLHNQRPEMIAARLMLRGKQRIMIINVPWHMPDSH